MQRRAARVHTRLFTEKDLQLPARKRKTAQEDQRERQRPDGKSRGKKSRGREIEIRIEIQILRVAHRREHAAEIGGDSLQHDDTDQRVAPLGHTEYDDRKGYKGQKRNVVGDQHRAEEAEQHQQQTQGAQAPAWQNEPGEILDLNAFLAFCIERGLPEAQLTQLRGSICSVREGTAAILFPSSVALDCVRDAGLLPGIGSLLSEFAGRHLEPTFSVRSAKHMTMREMRAAVQADPDIERFSRAFGAELMTCWETGGIFDESKRRREEWLKQEEKIQKRLGKRYPGKKKFEQPKAGEPEGGEAKAGEAEGSAPGQDLKSRE
ncbi:MAG: hypothetical protein J5855_07890 [Mailhella sp.]|nr:hypothetical protein [Mailhella sp.]